MYSLVVRFMFDLFPSISKNTKFQFFDYIFHDKYQNFLCVVMLPSFFLSPSLPCVSLCEYSTNVSCSHLVLRVCSSVASARRPAPRPRLPQPGDHRFIRLLPGSALLTVQYSNANCHTLLTDREISLRL